MTTQSQLHPQRSKNLPHVQREGEDASVSPRQEAGEIHVDAPLRNKSTAAPAPLDANEADRFAASFRPSWAPLAELEPDSEVRPVAAEPPAPVSSDGIFNAGNTDEPLTLPGRGMKRRALGLTAASVASFFLLAYWGISSTNRQSHDEPASDTNAATHVAAPPTRTEPALPPAAAQPEPVAPATSEPSIAEPAASEPAPSTALAAESAQLPPEGEQSTTTPAPMTEATAPDLGAQPAPLAAPAELAKLETPAAAEQVATEQATAEQAAAEAARAAAAEEAARSAAEEAAKRAAEAAEAEAARKLAAETAARAEAAARVTEQRRAESARATLEAEKDRAAAAAQPVPAPAPPQLAAAAVKTPESATETSKSRNPLLVVRALPEGSKLWLDGQRMANPFDVRLPAGYRHHIEARADGYEPTSQMVRLESDAKLTITLRRAAPAPAGAGTAADSRRRGAGFVAESPY